MGWIRCLEHQSSFLEPMQFQIEIRIYNIVCNWAHINVDTGLNKVYHVLGLIHPPFFLLLFCQLLKDLFLLISNMHSFITHLSSRHQIFHELFTHVTECEPPVVSSSPSQLSVGCRMWGGRDVTEQLSAPAAASWEVRTLMMGSWRYHPVSGTQHILLKC